jgi:hypothetical protein
MIRIYCDLCLSEITDTNAPTGSPVSHNRLGGTQPWNGAPERGFFIFEVCTGLKDTWNEGHFCKYCIIDAVNELDDRPRSQA